MLRTLASGLLLVGIVVGTGCSRDLQTIPTANDSNCSDGVRNGSESDIDCGGSCNACPDFSDCSVGSDCQSLSCFSFTCVPPSCFDGIRNGTETDVDCGGGCDACADNLACNLDADCASRACDPDLKTCIELTEDDFIIQDATEFADLAGVQILSGNLTIALPDMVTTLPTLELREVRGNVTIFANEGLLNLGDPLSSTEAGLSSLERILGNLVIRFNESLVDLSALQGVTQVGSVRISDNASLPDLDGLESLTVVDGLIISFNDSLLSLDGDVPGTSGLSGLTQINGALEISNNPQLIGLNGLGGLTSVRGNLDIAFNETLQFVDALYSINSIGGNLTFLANDSLTAVGDSTTPAFFALANVGGTITFDNNFTLQQVLGFDALLQAGGLKVEFHDSLQFVQGFESVILLEGSLVFSDNFALTSVPNFSSLDVVLGDFRFLRNQQLATLDGFGSLFVVAGNQVEGGDPVFWIDNNPLLSSMNGFASMDAIVGNLAVTNNATLSAFNGLELVAAPDGVSIAGNALTSLTLGAVVILGDLVIAEAGLQTLNLATLAEVEGSLWITGGTMSAVSLPALTGVCTFPSSGATTATPCEDAPTSNVDGCLFTIQDTPATTIAVPLLEDTNSQVGFFGPNCMNISGNLVATSLDLGSLTSVYALRIDELGRNAVSTNINLSSLDSILSLQISGGRTQADLTFPMTDAGNFFQVDSIADLETVTFSNSLEFGTFQVSFNPELSSVTVQSGSSVRDPTLSDLSGNECLDQTLADGLDTELCGGLCMLFTGNGGSLPCP